MQKLKLPKDPLIKHSSKPIDKHCTTLLDRREHSPHQYLGLHSASPGKILRLFRPGADAVHIELFGSIVETKPILFNGLQKGFFELIVPEKTTAADYRVYHASGLLAHDPYALSLPISSFDAYLFNKGVHYELYKMLGAHEMLCDDIPGTRFAVWAPNATSVSLVADFNHWDGRVNPMRNSGHCGIWELFVPGVGAGEKYKFEIVAKDGQILVKTDPFAFSAEKRPKTASIVTSSVPFLWNDELWLELRESGSSNPLNVYEVHLGSWRKHEGEFLNYRDIAIALGTYCREMGFTHVELMPIQEHPLDESWGYQVTGFFAVTSRFGSVEDFKWFVNHLHSLGIGVILDWVPGHFPTDAFALGCFDGTALFEHSDPRQGFHPHWSTYIFNFGRNEVSNFLISNALYWFEEMHVDGLRVDAVASMLYLDYGREEGQWLPNKHGGKENLEAMEFLKHLNSIVHQKHPSVMMIAEESTSFPRVTYELLQGGLGFDFKWNMGWMNDTLRYFSKDTVYRNHHHNDLTFGLLYAFSERFILPLSHDEVVHGKNSLIGRMPGDPWQQFANMRLLYSYLICQPGKKLLFMGGELGQWNEWNCKGEIEWNLLSYPIHHGLQTMVRDLNHFYLNTAALWEKDSDYNGFEWVDFTDRQNCVVSYLRKGSEGILLCIHNCTPVYYHHYTLKLSNVASIAKLFNTDEEKYGGSGKTLVPPKILNDGATPYAIEIELAPLATMIYQVEFL